MIPNMVWELEKQSADRAGSRLDIPRIIGIAAKYTAVRIRLLLNTNGKSLSKSSQPLRHLIFLFKLSTPFHVVNNYGQ